MSPFQISLVIILYFIGLYIISWFTSRNANTHTFFTANRKSPWYLVAFGMIGASLSGVTFISVPGEVGNSAFAYFQFVLGNLVGYWLVASILLSLYYRLNLVSIYTYLGQRFGVYGYKTGAFFFILSKLVGAAFRFYLVALVLQVAFFDALGIPFSLTVFISMALIWIYTQRAGIKTIVWTDTLQTLFLVSAVIFTIVSISRALDLDASELATTIINHPSAQIFNWDWAAGNNFFKQFFAGIFMTIAMVGLDQDMMQKNLTCKTKKESQKNMLVFSALFVATVFLFLCLGVLLYVYANNQHIPIPLNTDNLYPNLAINELGIGVTIAFLLGIISAAYSSADSALTALTTSFCFDFLGFKKEGHNCKTVTRKIVHISFSILVAAVVIIFHAMNNESVVMAVFKAAGYTYGPLLGLFVFGMYTNRVVNDFYIPFIALLAPILSWLITENSEKLLFGYKFGFEVLILNAGLMWLGLRVLPKKKSQMS